MFYSASSQLCQTMGIFMAHFEFGCFVHNKWGLFGTFYYHFIKSDVFIAYKPLLIDVSGCE